MRYRLASSLLLLTGILIAPTVKADEFRPPAVPLVVHDPYFSVWSTVDRLTDDVTRHWTNAPQPLEGAVRIDGRSYRVMGPEPKHLPALEQVGLEVRPTQTIYHFTSPEVALDLTFLTPALPSDLDLMSRPVTYVIFRASSRDGKSHEVEAYLGASALLTVNDPGQKVTWEHSNFGSFKTVRMGTEEQPVLQRAGDAVRIDWGHLYLVSSDPKATLRVVEGTQGLESFGKTGNLPESDTEGAPRAANDRTPSLAATVSLGKTGREPVEAVFLLAYDDDKAIDYMGQWLSAYWKRKGQTIADAIQNASRDFEDIRQRCDEFDQNLTADLEKAGGTLYARLGSLAHRESLAGSKLVADAHGMPLWFPKENSSNGCIGTVDVIYPQIPHLLLLNPELAKASVVPVLDYASSNRWKFPFAPHDLGTYPLATGQVYGGGERTDDNQMPVEESGNMLIIVEAIATLDGNADFASRYWPTLSKWAGFLEKEGFDPANQLSTDDFAGHLARNANLSIKAIVGLACYGKLAGMRGDQATETRYLALARSMARKWVEMADAGDHYRLTFDPGESWSQKYNLVWDHILGLNLFPEEVVRKELAYYQTVMQPFGLPLDSRKKFTKLDWEVWTASLASDKETFEKLIAPLEKFINETPDRVPLSDFYWTDSGKHAGMKARPVVGGVFIRLLDDRDTWMRWASQAKKVGHDWAPIPTPPKTEEIVATSRDEPQTWRYTTHRPAEGWMNPDFDDSQWEQGPGGFGVRDTPGSVVRTEWNTDDLWIRRTIDLPRDLGDTDLRLFMHHDEDVEVYLNGVLAARQSGFTTDYRLTRMTAEAREALKPGANVLAVHCHQTGGGQYLDVGLARIVPDPSHPKP